MTPPLSRAALTALLSAAAAAAGCADASTACDPGRGDACAPPCGEGTVLDLGTGSCVIDPGACQGGTVLVRGQCVDPTAGLDIDLREGPEPNNVGIVGLEDSAALAGRIELGAGGRAFVVRGTITPFRDADGNGELDPDLDAYALTVAAPTLLDISVDGVGGLMGAFVVVPLGDNPAVGWRRFGMSLAGDSSRRQIYLPAAGTYGISVADARSLFVDSESPPAAGNGGAAGGPEAAYYLSITALPTPAPIPLTVDGGVAVSAGTIAPGEVKLFTAPLGLGLNDIELAIPGTPRAALAVTRNDAYRADGAARFDFFAGALPARATAGGFLPGDRALIAVDTVYHYGPSAAPYTLTVRTGDATPLSRAGGAAAQPSVRGKLAAFYYDVAAADELTGLALAWNQPVGAVIVDDRRAPAASFTFDPASGAFTDRTFTTYTGLVRHRRPGRYYLLAFAPGDSGPAELVVTSTIAAQAAPALAPGEPRADLPASATFQSSAFTYDAGGAPWQVFGAAGAGTGPIALSFFDPATAYGRLDPLASAGSGALAADAAPLFTLAFPEAGAARSRVLLDEPTARFLAVARPAVAAGATLALDFRPRAYRDLGALAAGQTAAVAAEPLDPASPGSPARYYLVRATPGVKLTISASPRAPDLDTVVQLLTRDEAVDRLLDAGGPGVADTAQLRQSGGGWTALAVTAAAPPPGAAFDLAVGASAFVLPVYARGPGTTAYADACAGGAVQPLTSDGSTAPPSGEGFTPPIRTPPGFQFFGLLEPRLTASTNGWLGFGSAARAAPANTNMPSAAQPNGIVAPYWDDLANVTICTRTVGSRLTVQWTGNLASSGAAVVQAQAILDGTTGAIELVWGPGQVPTGTSATIGIEDQTGASASKLGYNTGGVAVAGTAVMLTPM